jgi:hypothetical protein
MEPSVSILNFFRRGKVAVFVHGEDVNNLKALANPEALAFF